MTFQPPVLTHHRAQRQRTYARHADVMPTPQEMRARLLTVLGDASDATWTEGIAWYPSAHSIAADMATGHELAVAQCAGVIAALSPQTGWATNVANAEQACADGHADNVGHYPDSTDKATAILRGADPFTVLGGRKVRSFYPNILRPTTSGPVTIDRHMSDLFWGGPGKAPDKALERPGVYVRCAGVVRSCARELGYLPLELQAVAWCAWRQLHDIAYRYDLDGTNF